jgi:hypothetical protein
MRRVSRLWVASVLLWSAAAPLAHAVTLLAAAEPEAHDCCPEGAPPADPAAPCQFATPYACCSQAGVPAATQDVVPFALLTLTVPLAPAALPPASGIARAGSASTAPLQIPPLLRSRVLLL